MDNKMETLFEAIKDKLPESLINDYGDNIKQSCEMMERKTGNSRKYNINYMLSEIPIIYPAYFENK